IAPRDPARGELARRQPRRQAGRGHPHLPARRLRLPGFDGGCRPARARPRRAHARRRGEAVRARGFTLMELMISIGILAIIAGLVYGSFSPIWQAREEVEAQADRYHAIRLAMERMRRDL